MIEMFLKKLVTDALTHSNRVLVCVKGNQKKILFCY